MGNVAHMGKREMYAGFWWGNVNEGDDVGGAGINGRIMLSSESRMGRCFCLFVFGTTTPSGPGPPHSRVF